MVVVVSGGGAVVEVVVSLVGRLVGGTVVAIKGRRVVELDAGGFGASLLVVEPEARISTTRPIKAVALIASSQRIISFRCPGLGEERSGAVTELGSPSWTG